MIRGERVFFESSGFEADGNAMARYPAEKGTWIWHPGKSSTQTAFLRFRLTFDLEEAAMPVIHVTADQRFQLRCDGREVSFGPDRCDLEHWTVQSVQWDLAPGRHEMEALAWWIADPFGKDGNGISTDTSPRPASPPMAQITWRGGFLLCAEGVDPSLLDTGSAPWVVDDLTDAVKITAPDLPHYNDVGPSFLFIVDSWERREGAWPTRVMPPLASNTFGVRRPGWCLYPADLPEQHREIWKGGEIRAFRNNGENGPWHSDEMRGNEVDAWHRLIAGGEALTLPPRSTATVLWDLQDYVCGYPVAETGAGRGSVLEWSWAEALYQESDPAHVATHSTKGDRDEITNKVFLGLGDRWELGPASPARLPALWWRAGRYVRLRFQTGDTPLVVRRLQINTTGYPLRWSGTWRSSDPAWDGLMPLFQRAFRCSAHETWTDTPYYEQMCYVGDTLLHALSDYAWSDDNRLSRRAIRLFNWSRRPSGLVAGRYPSRQRQECPTYSLLWPLMVRDYAWWRDDLDFVKEMLPGIRGVLAEFGGVAREDGLLHHLPGWPFVDWVPEWSAPPSYKGYDPGVEAGDSSIVNLYWVLALLASAQIEEACGEREMMGCCRRKAARVFQRILERYWDEKQGLLRNTTGSDAASEHAQMFALLTGLLDPAKTRSCLSALCHRKDLAKATISGVFYLLDALYLHGAESEFHHRLEFWRALPGLGFKSTPEGPEPSRSDAHAWGAHPAWHMLASIAGIRPAAPGFAKVRVAPMPGSLEHFAASATHPSGKVAVSFCRNSREGVSASFVIRLPPGVTGALSYAGASYALGSGENRIDCPGAV